MIRPFAAAAVFATLALAGAAASQTYGQPVYLNAYGRPVGGTPLSEVETRSYVETGRWADGYSDRPQVHVPAPGYGRPYVSYGPGYRSYGYGGGHRYGHGDGYRDGHRHYNPRPHPGYRDAWGYDDDRPPSARRGRSDRSYRYRDDRGCGCADVYFHDR
ncbi:hypothetical protein [Brevundimonas sp.]|uniref:hypothetical protein n=1 Tax=Brevundimonas sp. TaxID=1871086 RepID=UPI002C520507|nr:hypothetical protein [Brevundimonas sp.]HWQ86682.1 hypothetical protein [Brevundimonas sp.]